MTGGKEPDAILHHPEKDNGKKHAAENMPSGPAFILPGPRGQPPATGRDQDDRGQIGKPAADHGNDMDPYARCLMNCHAKGVRLHHVLNISGAIIRRHGVTPHDAMNFFAWSCGRRTNPGLTHKMTRGRHAFMTMYDRLQAVLRG